MMAFAIIPKPMVALVSPPWFVHPVRNYVASLLFSDIRDIKPRQALDAGAGRLRNFAMFPPGTYTGVSNDMPDMERGLEEQAKLISKKGAPLLVELDLNEKFTYLGNYDLVVSTATLDYLLDPIDTLERLADLILPNGNALFSISFGRAREIKNSKLPSMFREVEAVPVGNNTRSRNLLEFVREECGEFATLDNQGEFSMKNTPEVRERMWELAVQEMTSPTNMSYADHLYVRCLERIAS